MSTVTFGGWLSGQESRQDAVGEMARHWRSVKGDRKIRALPSVESALKDAGSLAEGSPVIAWWDQTIAEYRGSRQGSLASGDLRVVPPLSAEDTEPAPGASPQSPQSIFMAMATVLDAHTRLLCAIAAKVLDEAEANILTSELTSITGLPAEHEPVGWRELAAVADFGASDETG